eukprot:2162038-Prymnesium_polylepis.1
MDSLVAVPPELLEYNRKGSERGFGRGPRAVEESRGLPGWGGGAKCTFRRSAPAPSWLADPAREAQPPPRAIRREQRSGRADHHTGFALGRWSRWRNGLARTPAVSPSSQTEGEEGHGGFGPAETKPQCPSAIQQRGGGVSV